MTAAVVLAARSAPAGPGSTAPYALRLHPAAWLAIGAIAAAYAATVHRAGGPAAPTRRQWWYLAGGLLSLAVALTWPVADLAAHWSLTALLVQRLLLTLAAAPLLLLALPSAFIAALTRSAPADRALEVLTRPVVAVVVFTVIAVGTLLTPVVAAQASSVIARGAVDAVILAGGVVLWGPVLRHIPGASRPSSVGQAVYLFVQSIVPGFPCVIYVFARHPLYPAFARAHAAIGLSALGDQQLAGIAAKVATLPVLWSVAWVALARAGREDAEGCGAGALTWSEVERQLERAQRLEKRGPGYRRRGLVRPRPGARFVPVPDGPGPGSGPPP